MASPTAKKTSYLETTPYHMNKLNFIDILESISGVSKIEGPHKNERDEITYYEFGFEYAALNIRAHQVINPLFTLNKLLLPFRYNIKKETTKLNILEAINNYNIIRPLLKANLINRTSKTIEIHFSTEFINEDKNITKDQIYALINIITASPLDFTTQLDEKKININML